MEETTSTGADYNRLLTSLSIPCLPNPTQPTFSSPEPVVSFELGTRMRRTRVYSIVFRSVYCLKCFLSLVRCRIEELKNHAIFQERLASWKRGKSGEISIPHKLGFSEISLPQSLLPSNVQILYFSKALFEGLIFGGTYIRRGLSTERNLRFKLDWASLVVESKFTVFALFYLVFEGNFPSTYPRGGLYLEGRLLNGGFFALPVCGAYIWWGLYMEGLIFGTLRYLLSFLFCL